ncbi:uncharacterized protein [Miscanthus floridulus]|uniref:uncharacterized protein n=1 Tax=Miscanthus floridulus TaxID=154761 RepID=UPI003458511B
MGPVGGSSRRWIESRVDRRCLPFHERLRWAEPVALFVCSLSRAPPPPPLAPLPPPATLARAAPPRLLARPEPRGRPSSTPSRAVANGPPPAAAPPPAPCRCPRLAARAAASGPPLALTAMLTLASPWPPPPASAVARLAALHRWPRPALSPSTAALGRDRRASRARRAGLAARSPGHPAPADPAPHGRAAPRGRAVARGWPPAPWPAALLCPHRRAHLSLALASTAGLAPPCRPPPPPSVATAVPPAPVEPDSTRGAPGILLPPTPPPAPRRCPWLAAHAVASGPPLPSPPCSP